MYLKCVKLQTYVQDQLWGNSRDVYDVLRQGHVYVCGDVSMASQVEKTLEGILQKHNNITEHEAAEALSKIRVRIKLEPRNKTKRYRKMCTI